MHNAFIITFPRWVIPSLFFIVALFVTTRAAAWFTDLLEGLSDQWNFSPGLLSLVSALGANIPNYAASLAAFAGGQGLVGLGIIVGSNIYNLAIILGIVTIAAPGQHGIALARPAMQDVRRVAGLAASMGLVALGSFALLPAQHALVPSLTRTALNLLILGLFLLLIRHAVQRLPAQQEPEKSPDRLPRHSVALGTVLTVLALGLAMLGAFVMVQAGQAVATIIQLSPVILSLVILAVATSLPNTVVAFRLARTNRAGTALEEVLSSNSINLALGWAVPLLFWPISVSDPLLLKLDLPLLCLLGFITLAFVQRRQFSRRVGGSFLVIYGLWIVVHVLQ